MEDVLGTKIKIGPVSIKTNCHIVNNMRSHLLYVTVVFVLIGPVFIPTALSAATEVGGVADEVTYHYHKMTLDEAYELRDAYGHADGSAIVDGFGTGLASPTESELLSMVGVVNVLDTVEADFGALPGTVNLSALSTFPAVGNQSTQPSCSAWAAAYYAYGFLEAVDNDWTQASLGEPSQLISPAWTYARTNSGRDMGSIIEENMMVIVDWGAATMATMPFDEYEYLDLGSPFAFREAPAHRASEVASIDYDGSSTIDYIKTLVSQGVPVTFGIDANEYKPAFSDGNHIISSDEYDSLDLNHAQTIVGYDDSITDDGETGAFWVVNSWGPSFASDGFYWFTYEALMELGVLGRAVLNYIVDIEDYTPQLVANWHFNAAPSRSASIEVGIGSPLSPLDSRTPFTAEDRSSSHSYPTYMCLDITEYMPYYESSTEEFFLDIGASPSRGTVSSFKVESHETGFMPGAASRTSAQSDDVPRSTPGTVTVTLPRYDVVSPDEAVDYPGLAFDSGTEVRWVPVQDGSAAGGDSIQSGDVADGETTSIELTIVGPAVLTFGWKVSSENEADTLSFSVPDSDIDSVISGDVDWAEVTHSIGEGTQKAYWKYAKDSDSSESDDTAWIDDVRISQSPPEFSLQESYAIVWNEPLLVTPIDIINPSGSELYFWYDWGDDSPITAGNPAEDHSASHAYSTVDDFTMTVWAADDYDNNVSETATVHVVDGNAKPVVRSLSASPTYDYYVPGATISFDVEVSDAEGDTVTVTVYIDSLGVEMSDSGTPDPGSSIVISLDYTCPVSREEPYVVEAEAADGEDHFTYQWDRAELLLLVNSPPEAVLEVDGTKGETTTVFEFDASGSHDTETPSSGLSARWDWDGDGEWDTEWSESLTASHQFLFPGVYTVVVEVMDGSSLTSTDSVEVEVGGEAIPEFTLLLVPIVAVILLFALVAQLRRKR